MDKEAVKEIVRETVSEMMSQNLVKYDEDIAYRIMGKQLFAYFENEEADKKIKAALQEIDGEDYACIIRMCYKEKKTFLEIAEELECDISTVTRNKKKLVLKVYDMIYS